MAFNFPDAPAEDQVFTPSGGPTYVYKAPRWLVQMAPAAAGVTTDDAAPGSPVDGQLWYKSNTGDTYIWYVDPSGVPGQWVQVNVMPATGSSPVATAQTRSRIVNGAMQIAQEYGLDTSVPMASAAIPVTADQWYLQHISASTTAASAVRASTADSVKWGLRFGVGTVTDTSLAAGDIARIYTIIEGGRIADFAWGTASAKQAVLRFTVKSSMTGIFCVCIRNSPTTYTYVKNCTITTANVDQEFNLVIPGGVSGTWATDATAGILIQLTIMSGATAGVEGWQAGTIHNTSAISNWLGTANATFELTKVGLYLDPQNTGVAPAWEMPDEAEELRACQRYWYVADNPSSMLGYFYGAAGAASMGAGFIPYPVAMRYAPTAATITAPTYTNCSALVFTSLGGGSDIYMTGARVTVTAAGVYRALNGKYTFSARM